MHDTLKILHGNITVDSVLFNRSGQVKIGVGARQRVRRR